ncbi:MAG: hypothetical protein LAN71_09715 [Acidobacteriia bacterium]|nr:hypothetical protein [Terriglobia bacterium]
MDIKTLSVLHSNAAREALKAEGKFSKDRGGDCSALMRNRISRIFAAKSAIL